MNQTRVLIVDDHAVVRKGIRILLSTEPSFQIVGEAKDARDAVRKAEELRPNVILMDLAIPCGGGIEATAAIKRSIPDVKIIVLTMFADVFTVRAAMEAGADGYVLKDADGDALVGAVHAVQRGGMPLHPRIAQDLVNGIAKRKVTSQVGQLTKREKDVLRLVARGLGNRAVAEILGLSAGTVKVHVGHILDKLDVSSRTEAAVCAVQMGLVLPGGGTREPGI